MIFTAPLALLLLVPWAAALAWALLGRADVVWVPFANVWPRNDANLPVQRRLRPPPVHVILILLAMLAAVLAAAGPEVRGWGAGEPFTIVLDRGLATSAALAGASEGQRDPLTTLAENVAGDTPVIWIDAATSETRPTTLAAFRAALSTQRPTAIDVAQRLPQVVRTALAERPGPVVVSRFDPRSDDARVRWVVPRAAITNAGIERFAITPGTRPQAMVRIYNGTPAQSAVIRIGAVERRIDLPPAGASGDYFIDLPPAGESVTAELRLDDAIAADNVAYLARVNDWSRVVTRRPLPAALARLVRIYTDQRPPTADSREIEIETLASTATQSPPSSSADRAVLLAPAAGDVAFDRKHLVVAPHAITRDVDWPALLAGTTLAPTPPGEWQAIVRVGDRAALAVRESPQRQVWVGFDPSANAGTAAYVVFWTAVFDFLGDGPATYASEQPRTPPSDWKRDPTFPPLPIDAAPGIFHTPTGPRAISVAAVRIGPPGSTATESPLRPGARPLRRPLMLLAAASLVAAQLVPVVQKRSRTVDR